MRTATGTFYVRCEACGTPTPESDMGTLQTPIKPLYACPTCQRWAGEGES